MKEDPEKDQSKWAITWGGFCEELRKTSRLAAPMVIVSMLQYLLPVVSLIIAGHLGELALSNVAIATSLTWMAGGLETLCGQAYGSGHHKMLGTYTYTAMISLTLICPPMCLLWVFLDKLLPLVGQDPPISLEARNYSIWLISALFGSAILKPLTRFLQTQGVVLPMLMSSILVLCMHAILCCVLAFKVGLGAKGTAVAFGFSTWFNILVLGLYVKFSSVCENTRAPFSRAAFCGVGQFFRLGVLSAVMVCLKWWSMEMLTLLSGLLPNPELETSVLSICLTISTLHFTIPYGFGAAACTRVSNELGDGNPELARMAVVVAVSLAAVETIIVTIALFFGRNVIGYAYTKNGQVRRYLTAMAPLICLSLFTDSLQAVLSDGFTRGCGWQKIGAYINLGAFYLVGLPLGAILGFVAHLRGKGLWIGIVAGSCVQASLFSLITSRIDWKKQVVDAKDRILQTRSSK